MKETLFDNLMRAILEYDAEAAESLANESIAAGIDPIETLDILTKAIQIVGEQFGSGKLYLPELIAAAEAMSKATAQLEAEIQRQGRKKDSICTVVIGTVRGDIHDIGKNMVATLFKASGFDVVDCGINVTADTFIQAIQKHNADMLALSALLSTTAPEQRKVINTLIEKGLRDKVKVMVGGGGITKKFAEDIGADGYDATASGAVVLGKRLMGISEAVS
jgi:corrinoid protein of di/trimethylamine methyltransferase